MSSLKRWPQTPTPLETYHQQIELLTKQLKEKTLKIKELEKLCHQDELTGLLNRRGLIYAFEKIQSYAQRFAWSGFISVWDIDKFKDINDRYGHYVGDQTLLKIAETMTHSLRKTDIIARISGDEFVIILSPINEINARERLQDLQRKINQTKLPIASPNARFVRISYGATPLIPEQNLSVLLEKADKSMYVNKYALS